MIRNEIELEIIIIVVLFFLFSGFGMMDFNSYGFSTMCSHIGGIWCYWPSGGLRVLIIIILFLAIVALLLFIFWMIKQFQNSRIK